VTEIARWSKPAEAAAEAAVWGALEAEAKKRKDAAREYLLGQMGPDLLAVKAVVNGTTVGRATFVEGKSEFKVTDHAAFIRFVTEHYPTEVMTEVVTSVSSAFQAKLLAEVKAVAGTIVDGNGVEVLGVAARTSKPYVLVKKADDVLATVGDLLAGGSLTLDAPKALPSSVIDAEVIE